MKPVPETVQVKEESIPGGIDKTKYLQILDDFEVEWTNDLSQYFGARQNDSTMAQLRKSRQMLTDATNLTECKVVENRIRKLSDWISFHKETE